MKKKIDFGISKGSEMETGIETSWFLLLFLPKLSEITQVKILSRFIHNNQSYSQMSGRLQFFAKKLGPI